MKTRWRSGNRARLLENGEAYFPAVFDAIRGSRTEVILETFILFEDKVGIELHDALVEAARRGVQVDVMVDGFGSCDLTSEFIRGLIEAGVRLRTFDPTSRILGIRFNVLRRMHRKIVVVDRRLAFVGGINFSCDHLADFGPQAKQDYAVALEGPIVDEVRRFAVSALRDDDARAGVVGGVAFRYRLYARQGLSADITTQVLALSMLTNWLGYLLLAGGVFLLAPPDLPAGWKVADAGLRAIGAGMLLAAAAYIVACVASPRREWRFAVMW